MHGGRPRPRDPSWLRSRGSPGRAAASSRVGEFEDAADAALAQGGEAGQIAGAERVAVVRAAIRRGPSEASAALVVEYEDRAGQAPVVCWEAAGLAGQGPQQLA